MTLIITADEVRLVELSGGTYWAHPLKSLPDWLYTVTERCLEQDSQLCNSMIEQLERHPESS